MDLSGRRCRGGALPPALAGQAAQPGARSSRPLLFMPRRLGPSGTWSSGRPATSGASSCRYPAARGCGRVSAVLLHFAMPVARPGWRYRRGGRSRV